MPLSGSREVRTRPYASRSVLVTAFPAERIRAKLEVFDWLVEQNRLSENPAGYLCVSIREDYAAPKGFEPRAERARKRPNEGDRNVSRKFLEQQRLSIAVRIADDKLRRTRFARALNRGEYLRRHPLA